MSAACIGPGIAPGESIRSRAAYVRARFAHDRRAISSPERVDQPPGRDFRTEMSVTFELSLGRETVLLPTWRISG